MKKMMMSLLSMSLVSSAAFASQNEVEYSHVKSAISELMKRPLESILENSRIAGKGEYQIVLFTSNIYKERKFGEFDPRKVFALVQKNCEGDSISGAITPGCLTESIIQSKK